MNNQFKPIYIWGQKLEDTPENDFFKVSNSELQKVTNTEEMQSVVHEMGKINRVKRINWKMVDGTVDSIVIGAVIGGTSGTIVGNTIAGTDGAIAGGTSGAMLGGAVGSTNTAKKLISKVKKRLSKKDENNNNTFAIKKSDKKVLIKFDTHDKDSANRPTQLDVLLDINGINHFNVKKYCNYLYDAMNDFSTKTNRNIIGLDGLKSDKFQEELLKKESLLNKFIPKKKSK